LSLLGTFVCYGVPLAHVKKEACHFNHVVSEGVYPTFFQLNQENRGAQFHDFVSGLA
jgi:Mn-dependent DtxR family transcriptional regulator